MDDKEKNKLILFTESKSFKNRYEYIGYLGRGGFGVVIKCRKTKPDENGEKEEFALKVINKEKASKRYLNFLLNEARIHRTLKHPNIVEFYSIKESKSKLYIEMEVMDGGNLNEFIKREEQIGEAKAAEVMKGVLQAVRYLHKNKIIHRDIKPRKK